jgi:hypothetical protein
MLTLEDTNQIRLCAVRGKPYKGLTEVRLGQISAAAHDQGLAQFFSELVTGSRNMTDVTYQVVDFKGDAANTLIVEVSGRVEEVAKEIAASQIQDA